LKIINLIMTGYQYGRLDEEDKDDNDD